MKWTNFFMKIKCLPHGFLCLNVHWWKYTEIKKTVWCTNTFIWILVILSLVQNWSKCDGTQLNCDLRDLCKYYFCQEIYVWSFSESFWCGWIMALIFCCTIELKREGMSDLKNLSKWMGDSVHPRYIHSEWISFLTGMSH